MAGSLGAGSTTTLLGRLQQNSADQEAWAEFVRRYGPQIHRWCQSWHLQEADAIGDARRAADSHDQAADSGG